MFYTYCARLIFGPGHYNLFTIHFLQKKIAKILCCMEKIIVYTSSAGQFSVSLISFSCDCGYKNNEAYFFVWKLDAITLINK